MTPRFTQKVIEISIERKSEGADQVGRQTPTRDDHRLGFGARYTTGCRQLESVILTAGARGPDDEFRALHMKGDFAILNLRSDDPIQFTGTVNIPENWAPPIIRWAPNSFEVVQ